MSFTPTSKQTALIPESAAPIGQVSAPASFAVSATFGLPGEGGVKHLGSVEGEKDFSKSSQGEVQLVTESDALLSHVRRDSRDRRKGPDSQGLLTKKPSTPDIEDAPPNILPEAPTVSGGPTAPTRPSTAPADGSAFPHQSEGERGEQETSRRWSAFGRGRSPKLSDDPEAHHSPKQQLLTEEAAYHPITTCPIVPAVGTMLAKQRSHSPHASSSMLGDIQIIRWGRQASHRTVAGYPRITFRRPSPDSSQRNLRGAASAVPGGLRTDFRQHHAKPKMTFRELESLFELAAAQGLQPAGNNEPENVSVHSHNTSFEDYNWSSPPHSHSGNTIKQQNSPPIATTNEHPPSPAKPTRGRELPPLMRHQRNSSISIASEAGRSPVRSVIAPEESAFTPHSPESPLQVAARLRTSHSSPSMIRLQQQSATVSDEGSSPPNSQYVRLSVALSPVGDEKQQAQLCLSVPLNALNSSRPSIDSSSKDRMELGAGDTPSIASSPVPSVSGAESDRLVRLREAAARLEEEGRPSATTSRSLCPSSVSSLDNAGALREAIAVQEALDGLTQAAAKTQRQAVSDYLAIAQSYEAAGTDAPAAHTFRNKAAAAQRKANAYDSGDVPEVALARAFQLARQADDMAAAGDLQAAIDEDLHAKYHLNHAALLYVKERSATDAAAVFKEASSLCDVLASRFAAVDDPDSAHTQTSDAATYSEMSARLLEAAPVLSSAAVGPTLALDAISLSIKATHASHLGDHVTAAAYHRQAASLVQSAVDSLVAQGKPRKAGEIQHEVARDLLRASSEMESAGLLASSRLLRSASISAHELGKAMESGELFGADEIREQQAALVSLVAKSVQVVADEKAMHDQLKQLQARVSGERVGVAADTDVIQQETAVNKQKELLNRELAAAEGTRESAKLEGQLKLRKEAVETEREVAAVRAELAEKRHQINKEMKQIAKEIDALNSAPARLSADHLVSRVGELRGRLRELDTRIGNVIAEEDLLVTHANTHPAAPQSAPTHRFTQLIPPEASRRPSKSARPHLSTRRSQRSRVTSTRWPAESTVSLAVSVASLESAAHDKRRATVERDIAHKKRLAKLAIKAERAAQEGGSLADELIAEEGSAEEAEEGELADKAAAHKQTTDLINEGKHAIRQQQGVAAEHSSESEALGKQAAMAAKVPC
ncbi:unnamed protein product [Vitrella brassicaformis CCMP3155]|uniref:Uncharacterized protein n=1 Tax=Vitrella brassicaformis (strain CCMP3155) TaxID=1169540 RepID=A0A0G4GJT3_VITBC|nr:unnamed protein product [Vitrella brassicaformis CCMP3155]|eukprot:CEM30205.1 unnamed protein product [Vitrella brassicaformis CCMP3155]